MIDIGFHPDVYQDIAAALLWYENQSPGLGEFFLVDLEASYKRILAHRHAWPRFSNNTRYCLLERFPYAIVYAADEKIKVLAVKHNRRSADYLEERL